MYKIQVTRVKLSDLISKSKFINTNQMSIHLFPVMLLYALQWHQGYWRLVQRFKNAWTDTCTPHTSLYCALSQMRLCLSRHNWLPFHSQCGIMRRGLTAMALIT